MKIYEIMMFLLLFNVVISLVGALNIYHMGDPGIGEDELEGFVNTESEGALWVFLGQSAIAMFTGTVAGALIGFYGARIPTSEGMAYGFFATLIGLIFVSSSSVLWQITMFVPEAGLARYYVQVMVGLFLAVCGVLFAIGFLQLVRGGISSYV